mgnify:CR=1 FL=1
MESAGIFDLKRRNRSNVFSYIYSNKHCAKQEIAAALNLSLPTVSQNLKELFESNFIINGGLYESTGGRKAAILQCKTDARVAIGVEILKDYAYVTLCDLYGQSLKSDTLRLTYKNDESYFSADQVVYQGNGLYFRSDSWDCDCNAGHRLKRSSIRNLWSDFKQSGDQRAIFFEIHRATLHPSARQQSGRLCREFLSSSIEGYVLHFFKQKFGQCNHHESRGILRESLARADFRAYEPFSGWPSMLLRQDRLHGVLLQRQQPYRKSR